MSYVRINTLTPLHVGSGRTYQSNAEYLYFKDEKQVVVIDEQKVLNLIGEAHVDQWVNIITNGKSLLQYLKERRPGLEPNEVARRVLAVKGPSPEKRQQPVREQLHAGNGDPLLPGSSLKGAIRTALLASQISDKPMLAKGAELKQRNNFKDKSLQESYFGADPNHDLLRLLRIGDAHFPGVQTLCLQVDNLSRKGEETYLNKNVEQYAECLPAGCHTMARIQVPTELVKQLNKPNYQAEAPKNIPLVSDLQQMLDRINQHTRGLLERELARYEDLDLPPGADSFTEELEMLLEEVNSCRAGECVLRVGFGAGYHFMTGEWQPAVVPVPVQEEISTAARPRHYRGATLPLPRSRRMVLNGQPMGFLKLTLLTDEEALTEQSRILARQLQLQEEAEQQARQAAQLAKDQKEQQQQEQALAAKKAAEALKPQYFTGKLKQGAELDASFIRTDKNKPKMKVFRLLIGEPGKEQEVSLSYMADLDPEKTYKVRIGAVTNKGQVQSIQFVGEKK